MGTSPRRTASARRRRTPGRWGSSEHRVGEGGKGAGAVRKVRLLVRLHLAEGALVAKRHEHRVVAEAVGAARRPHQRALDLAAEDLAPPIGEGETEHGDEPGGPLV